MTTYTDKPIPLADLGKMKPRRRRQPGQEETEEPKPDLTLIELVGNAQAISRKVDPDRPVLLSRQRITGDTILLRPADRRFPGPSAGVVYLYDRGDNAALQPGPKPNDAMANRRPIRPTAAGPKIAREGRPRSQSGTLRFDPGADADPVQEGDERPVRHRQRHATRPPSAGPTSSETSRAARAVVSDERKILDYDRLPPTPTS